MESDIKKLFHKALKKESIFEESNKNPSNQNVLNNPNNSNLSKFKKQCSNLHIFPLESKDNHPDNYSKYIETTLIHISQLKDINFEYALQDPKIKEGVPHISFNENKKILLLDLDETLIHADFDEEYEQEEYDTIIKFKAESETKQNKNEKYTEDNESTMCCLSEIEEGESEDIHEVGIFLRNGVKKFLEEICKYFEVGIFTASVKEYADAVISYLDPENKLIKFRLYRNNCINFKDSFTIKDLRIFPEVDLKKIVLLDNSMYSFTTQISNGILINSFFDDKKDNELQNAFEYLIKYILPAKDVRDVNEQFFNFRQIIDNIA